MDSRTLENLDRAAYWLRTHDVPENASVHANATPTASEVFVFAYDADAMREARREIGSMTKTESGSGGFTLDAEHDGIRFVIFPPQGTCKKVKVGERVEQVTKEVRPAETVTVEETVDVYEWDCGGVLVEDDAEAVSA